MFQVHYLIGRFAFIVNVKLFLSTTLKAEMYPVFPIYSPANISVMAKSFQAQDQKLRGCGKSFSCRVPFLAARVKSTTKATE